MLKKYRFIIHLLLSLLLVSCATSQASFDIGIANFRSQNYRTAFIKLLPIAESGNSDAQYAVGYMYYYGQGVTEDRDKALYWMRLASKAGQPDAVKALRIIHSMPPSPYRPARNPKKRPIPIQSI
jgi:TPR repeat protein